MTIERILSWAVCGFVVGLLARLLVPGRQSMGMFTTMVVGIIGALIGGFLYSQIRGNSVEPFSLTTNNWYGWIVAILGAMLLVWVYPRISSQR
jgi:uncharacterized membrane protein YeaQ/YmgE (transglycosylase-associated protein family)